MTANTYCKLQRAKESSRSFPPACLIQWINSHFSIPLQNFCSVLGAGIQCGIKRMSAARCIMAVKVICINNILKAR